MSQMHILSTEIHTRRGRPCTVTLKGAALAPPVCLAGRRQGSVTSADPLAWPTPDEERSRMAGMNQFRETDQIVAAAMASSGSLIIVAKKFPSQTAQTAMRIPCM
uniref:Uncharacterized protein n=1 Tax=Bionectria ochroleuca TaxID=29856 RepID=A0A8H7TTK6_BIOOC